MLERPKPNPLESESSQPPSFMEKLYVLQRQGKSLCLGLDPSWNHSDMLNFYSRIIAGAAPFATAIKPNAAFYEEQGNEGRELIEKLIAFMNENFPEVPILYDVKRGDVGHTNEAYARAIFDKLGADGMTVNGYVGGEALKPFFERTKKGIFVLAKTSNERSGELQDLEVDLRNQGRKHKRDFGDLRELGEILGRNIVALHEIVAYSASHVWNTSGNVGLVAGATFPDALKNIRKIANNAPFEVPILILGVGAQGGSLEAAVTNGQDNNGAGMLINSSRGLTEFPNTPFIEETVAQKAQMIHNEVNKNRILKAV